MTEKVYLSQLPETYSRTVAGEWTEATAGGSHISPNWRKNPKIDVKFQFSITNESPVKVRITLAKYGNEWRNMAKKGYYSSLSIYIICRLLLLNNKLSYSDSGF